MATSSALKERFFEMAGRVEQMGKLIDPRSLNSLKTARESLGIIIEDLQVMTAMGKVRRINFFPPQDFKMISRDNSHLF